MFYTITDIYLSLKWMKFILYCVKTKSLVKLYLKEESHCGFLLAKSLKRIFYVITIWKFIESIWHCDIYADIFGSLFLFWCRYSLCSLFKITIQHLALMNGWEYHLKFYFCKYLYICACLKLCLFHFDYKTIFPIKFLICHA